ncbi:class I SAM-dependent DNA methyltransferase [Glycomyces tritici]|uniref:Class I SAM-dependent methyltransferase n=1 Tax=Glycomyces tritici TaxID=2665176 RepID=A0ABT7YS40_9ACTN|nr:class I SAM-dependent methyltransferase [Glycomyces tritici]MDN3241461.1 class I SAM-dependent methyltransferase [Glycomyces tritici]MDN3242248.1 class I SAM-dependent methyltransferase [Glycomyces tritici]
MAGSSEHLSATTEAYDRVAVAYAEIVRDEFAGLPLDRAVLAAFAEYVQTGGPGLVAELGCGPGRVTAHLRDLGLEAFGVDLSPVMIDLARKAHPDLRFEVGSMDALDLAEGALRGIVSWYSVIHAPAQDVASYFAEFRRVLAPEGCLLVAFFESEGDPLTRYDTSVVPAYRWPIDELAGLAAEAGFVEIGRMLREPRAGERYRRGHLLMRRSA